MELVHNEESRIIFADVNSNKRNDSPDNHKRKSFNKLYEKRCNRKNSEKRIVTSSQDKKRTQKSQILTFSHDSSKEIRVIEIRK